MPFRKFWENLGPNLLSIAIVSFISTALTVLLATKMTAYRVEQLELAQSADRRHSAEQREADRLRFEAMIEKLDNRILKFEDSVTAWKEQNARALQQIGADVAYVRGRLESERKAVP